MKKEKRIFGSLLMGLTVIFFYLPIVFMVIFSFNSSKSLTHFEGFSTMWYEKMFANHDHHHCFDRYCSFYYYWNDYGNRFVEIKEAGKKTCYAAE